MGENKLGSPLLDEETTKKVEDFTPDELLLLKMAFTLVNNVVELQRMGNSDVYLSNALYSLRNKLGIDDLI